MLRKCIVCVINDKLLISSAGLMGVYWVGLLGF